MDGRNLTPSSSRLAAPPPPHTYFSLLSGDLFIEITKVLLKASRSKRERGSLPGLLLPEDSPLPAVFGKIFSVLELSASKSSALCPSFIGSAGDVGLNLAEDRKYAEKILREFLPVIKALRLRTDSFKDERLVRSFCRAMARKCVNLKSLEIKIGVLPESPTAFAVRVVNAIGGQLTTLSINNYSNYVGSQKGLAPLVDSISKKCVRLTRFEFRGHDADALLPIYNSLGGSLLELKIVVLSSIRWVATLGCLGRRCQRLNSVHLDSGIMVANTHIAPSGTLTDLLVSYGSRLVSASATMIIKEHIPLILSACPEARFAVAYGERWANHATRFAHLFALGSRIRELSLDGLEDEFCELVSVVMPQCDGIETMLVEDIHSNIGVQALFSTKHLKLRHLSLSLCNEKLEATTVVALANSTRLLEKLELQLNHASGTFSGKLREIAKSNPKIQSLSITEYGERSSRSAINLIKNVLDFVDCAPNLKHIEISLIPTHASIALSKKQFIREHLV